MSARFYVHNARVAVNGLRERLRKLGFDSNLSLSLDVELVAKAYLGCEVVDIAGLTDERALIFLQTTYGLDIEGSSIDDQPLAGALYVALDGAFRWIFVEQDDLFVRRRFTIAHEIAHLVLEAEPMLSASEGRTELGLDNSPNDGVLRFGRCPYDVLSKTLPTTPQIAPAIDQRIDNRRKTDRNQIDRRDRLGERNRGKHDDLREVLANHFAAELLLPYEGVRKVVAQSCTRGSIQTTADLVEIAALLADTYKVSGAAARLRLVKDMGIVPLSNDPNYDLFSKLRP